MGKKKFIVFIVFALVLVFLLPDVALAQGGAVGNDDPGGSTNMIPNPLGDASDPENSDPRVIIGRVVAAVLGIIGSIALVVFVYGGFTWMMSGGSQEKVKKGRDMIVWAVLGLAVVFLSYAIVSFVIQALTETPT